MDRTRQTFLLLSARGLVASKTPRHKRTVKPRLVRRLEVPHISEKTLEKIQCVDCGKRGTTLCPPCGLLRGRREERAKQATGLLLAVLVAQDGTKTVVDLKTQSLTVLLGGEPCAVRQTDARPVFDVFIRASAFREALHGSLVKGDYVKYNRTAESVVSAFGGSDSDQRLYGNVVIIGYGGTLLPAEVDYINTLL